MAFLRKYKLLIAILSVVILVFGISIKVYAVSSLTSTEALQTDYPTLSEYSPDGWYYFSAYTSGAAFDSQYWFTSFRIDASSLGPTDLIQLHQNDGGTNQNQSVDFYKTGELYSASTNLTGQGFVAIEFDVSVSGPDSELLVTVDWGTGYYKSNGLVNHIRADGVFAVYGENDTDYPLSSLDNNVCLNTLNNHSGPDQFESNCAGNLSSNIDMVYLVMNDTGEYIPPPENEIEITYPTSTAPYDFSQWEINFDTATSTTATSTDFYTIQIYAGVTSSTITNLSGGTSYTFNVGDLSVNNTRIFNQNVTYYSEAELRYFEDVYQDIGDLVATSDMVTFTTTAVSEQESESSYYPVPTSTSTSAEWTFTCDPESDLFSRSLCNLARWLFVPTPASIERFGNLQDTISEKPPFGYWTEIKGEVLTITTTTSAFTLTGVSVLAENDTFKTIKTTISVILWFLFTFWILHRIRLFDFQK